MKDHSGLTPRGFTLIELMVVIVIILLLLGLGAAIGRALLSQGGEKQLTNTALANAQLLLDDYMNLTGQAAPASTSALYAAIVGPPGISQLKSKMAGLPPQSLVGNTIIDGWSKELVLNNTGAPGSGLPARAGPYFASAGPDGNIATPADNIYSYNLGGN